MRITRDLLILCGRLFIIQTFTFDSPYSLSSVVTVIKNKPAMLIQLVPA